MKLRVVTIIALASVGLSAASGSTVASVPSHGAHAAARPDILSAMFAWWNESMRNHVPFDRAGFARFFAGDAVLRIDGVAAATGIDAITAHFKAIQGSGAEVEIVLPFDKVMVSRTRIYTYHVIRSRRDGRVSCMLAAGHADVAGGKITEISLVRAVVQPGSSPAAQACWQNT